jgi:branched-subunit amino acid permease
MPNLPAQKLLVILAGMHAILVSLGKTSAKNHATAQAEMEGIKERMATKDLLAALFGSHRDDIATLAETLGALQDQQQELMQRVTVAAVTLGVMLLGLAVLLGALLGGHR